MTDYNDEISLLIPAYLRGELSAADMAKVEAAAAVDPSVKADLSFQKSLRETLQSGQAPAASNELDWARLSRRLDELQETDDLNPEELPIVANDRPAKPSRFWMGATAALALLAVGQFAFMSQLRANDSAEDKYTLVIETTPGSQTSVTPGERAQLEELGRYLNSVDGQIVSGPSAIGLFDIDFKTRADCEAALPKLRDMMEAVSHCS